MVWPQPANGLPGNLDKPERYDAFVDECSAILAQNYTMQHLSIKMGAIYRLSRITKMDAGRAGQQHRAAPRDERDGPVIRVSWPAGFGAAWRDHEPFSDPRVREQRAELSDVNLLQ